MRFPRKVLAIAALAAVTAAVENGNPLAPRQDVGAGVSADAGLGVGGGVSADVEVDVKDTFKLCGCCALCPKPPPVYSPCPSQPPKVSTSYVYKTVTDTVYTTATEKKVTTTTYTKVSTILSSYPVTVTRTPSCKSPPKPTSADDDSYEAGDGAAIEGRTEEHHNGDGCVTVTEVIWKTRYKVTTQTYTQTKATTEKTTDTVTQTKETTKETTKTEATTTTDTTVTTLTTPTTITESRTYTTSIPYPVTFNHTLTTTAWKVSTYTKLTTYTKPITVITTKYKTSTLETTKYATRTTSTTIYQPTTQTTVKTVTTKVPIYVTNSTTIYSTKTETSTITTTTKVPVVTVTTYTEKTTDTVTQTTTDTDTTTTTEIRTTPTTLTLSETITSVVTESTSYPVTVSVHHTTTDTIYRTDTTTYTTTFVSVSEVVSIITNTITRPASTLTIPGPTITTTISGTPTTVTLPPTTLTQTVTGPGATQTIIIDVTACAVPTSAARLSTAYNPKSDLTWGCKPGSVCNPQKPAGCNFWEDSPADDYVCQPQECIQAPKLKLATWAEGDIDYYPPNAGYFNLDPRAFGLSFDIFEPPRVVTKVKHGHTTTITVDNYVSQPTLTHYPPAKAAPTAVPTKKGYGGKHDSRELGKAKLLNKRDDTIVPSVCFDDCNNCYLEAQSMGKTEALCAEGSQFRQDLDICQSCIEVNAAVSKEEVMKTYLEPKFKQYLDYCFGSAAPTGGNPTAEPQLPSSPPVVTTSQEPGNTNTQPIPVSPTATDTGGQPPPAAPSESPAAPTEPAAPAPPGSPVTTAGGILPVPGAPSGKPIPTVGTSRPPATKVSSATKMRGFGSIIGLLTTLTALFLV